MLSAAPACFSPAFCPSLTPPLLHLAAHKPKALIPASAGLAAPRTALLRAARSRRAGLRSSPTAFLPMGETEGVADASGLITLGTMLAAALSSAEGWLLSLHARMTTRAGRLGKVTAAGALMFVLSAVLIGTVRTTAYLLGSMARLAGHEGGQGVGEPAAAALDEEQVAEPAGEAPATVREIGIEHLAAAKYGGHQATQREVAAMEIVRDRVLLLTDKDREAMDTVWLDGLTPVDMLRYVRGNGGEGAKAADKLVATAVWRKEFDVANILEEEETTIDGFFANEVHEVDWLDEGADLEQGRPSLLYRSAVHTPQDIPTEKWVRFFVHQCEWARVHYPNDQVLVLVDRVGSGLSNQDPTVLRALAPVIIDHYPDTIGRVLIAPVNSVLFVIWGLVSLILDKTTKARMKLVKGKDWKKALVLCMDPKALPVRLGGTNTEL